MARTRSFDADAVVDAAMEQFWTRSYGTTSTDDLCTGSRLSRSSLYNTFGSKREVYLLALRRYVATKGVERDEVLALDLTGRELLRRMLLRGLDNQWHDASRRACLAINACLEIGQDDPEVTRLLEANAREFDRTLTAIVQRGQDDGSITATVPAEALARSLHAASDGLQVRSRVAPDREAIERDLDTLLTLI